MASNDSGRAHFSHWRGQLEGKLLHDGPVGFRSGQSVHRKCFLRVLTHGRSRRQLPQPDPERPSVRPLACRSASLRGCLTFMLVPAIRGHSRTAESFSFKYGRVDISAQLPKGDWIWPAMWLLPRHEAYGTWPASGEIDIMESRGNAPGYPGGGYDTFASTLHWGPYFPEDPYTKTHAAYTDPTSSLADKFHTYTLLWNETTMQTQLDGKVVLSVDIQQSFFNFGGWDPATTNNPWAGGGKNAPFDQEFYLSA